MGAAGYSSEDAGINYTEVRLDSLHEVMIAWDSSQPTLWEREPAESSQFLRVVDEVRQITEDLGEEEEELLSHGHNILQFGMSWLEDEFVRVLIENQQPVEPDHMSFRCTEDDFEYSSSSFEEGDQIQGKIRSESGREEFVIDVVHPVAVLDLKSIAEMMFLCKHDKECCQAYINVRKDTLEECLSVLGTERLSIEEIIQMDWTVLSSMIKRWNRALKVFVRVYLASERRLCDLIFRDLSASASDHCFRESSKSSILQLLTFGEAIAIGPQRPEKLFRILDMYQGLADLVIDIQSLFSDSPVLAECLEVLLRLSGCARGTFVAFKKAIRNNTSSVPFSGGGVHPVTKYVMNYITALAGYSDSLNLLLDDAMAYHLRSVASILESNIDARSMLYKDSSLQNLFKMNNICYMVQKVKDSDLQAVLGDDWVRGYSSKFRLYATNYVRASWSLVLSFLKEQGIYNANAPSKTILKERFRGFNRAFEEVYRTQTGWIVPNLELREDLKISISLKVVLAYRTFMGRYGSHLDGVRNRDSYIKYCPEDLEMCLLDLFEGIPKMMYAHRR